jgi:TatD DNase family protein
LSLRAQLEIAKKLHLPLFLHSRAAHTDFVALLTEAGMHENGGESVGGKGGVAHSFTGEINEMEELVSTFSRIPLMTLTVCRFRWAII